MKVKLRRNRINLSHYVCGTCFPGEIVPVSAVMVNPGDTFNHRVNGLIRFLPMVRPIMHRVWVDYYQFYTPLRVLWDGFENFITRTTPGGFPEISMGDIKASVDMKRFARYFGLNVQSADDMSTTKVSLLKFWNYNKVYNQWFRDQDLVTALSETSTNAADFKIRRAAWQKDGYTIARPWPQKGPEITIPLGTVAPVAVTEAERYSGTGSPEDLNFIRTTSTGGSPDDDLSTSTSATNPGNVRLLGEVDLSDATSASIIELRRAMNLQALAERLANFGSRYPEYLASMGVKSSDARLQIPEMIGRGRVPMSISEVLNTTIEDSGDMYGHGIAGVKVPSYRKFFEEHGIVMTVMVVRPQPIYSNAVDRSWFHGLVDGANDFYTPELERIGFQEIYNKEILPKTPGTGPGEDGDIWGYGPRYWEMRHQHSYVCGNFIPGEIEDEWTWARAFDPGDGVPQLNQTFIECDPSPVVFADQMNDPILFCTEHRLIAQRMITKNITGRII